MSELGSGIRDVYQKTKDLTLQSVFSDFGNNDYYIDNIKVTTPLLYNVGHSDGYFGFGGQGGRRLSVLMSL